MKRQGNPKVLWKGGKEADYSLFVAFGDRCSQYPQLWRVGSGEHNLSCLGKRCQVFFFFCRIKMNSGFSGIRICPWHLPICFRDLLPPSALEEEPSQRSRGLVSQHSSEWNSRSSENLHLRLSPHAFPEKTLQGPTDLCASTRPLQAPSSLKASRVFSAIAVQGFMYDAPISTNGS